MQLITIKTGAAATANVNPAQIAHLYLSGSQGALVMASGILESFVESFGTVADKVRAHVPLVEIETKHGLQLINPHFVCSIHDSRHVGEFAWLASGTQVQFKGAVQGVVKQVRHTVPLIEFRDGEAAAYVNPCYVQGVTAGSIVMRAGYPVKVAQPLEEVLAQLTKD